MKRLILDLLNKFRRDRKVSNEAEETAPVAPIGVDAVPEAHALVEGQQTEFTAALSDAQAPSDESVLTAEAESVLSAEASVQAEAEPEPSAEIPAIEAAAPADSELVAETPSFESIEPAMEPAVEAPVPVSFGAAAFAEDAGITLRELRAIFEGPDWSKLMRNARDGGATSILACRVLDKTMALLQHGNKHVERMLEAAQNVRATTGQLASVAEDIKQVSNQTRIVSINAGIEANRAGVHGRTFQVVAQQMTALSEDARNLTLTIDTKLHGVNEKININRELCTEVGKLFGDMNAELGEFRRMMMRVEELAEIQVEQLGQIEQIIIEPATKREAA